MKFSKTLLSCALVCAAPVWAVDSGDWTLSKDTVLNGVLENAADQQLNSTVTHNKFMSDSDISTNGIMGEFIETDDVNVVKFQEVSGSEVLNYTGKSTGSGYKGTWHSTNGDEGDFNLTGVTSSSGTDGSDDTYQPLNIEFIQSLSSGTTVSGDYNNVVVGSAKGWQSANTDYSITNGKWYWEMRYVDDNDSDTTYNGSQVIVGTVIASPISGYGSGNYAGYFYSDPGASYPRVFCTGGGTEGPNYGSILQPDDIVSVLLDMDGRTIEFAINGEKQGVACTDLPDKVYPAVSVWNKVEVDFNFGQSAWVYPELAK